MRANSLQLLGDAPRLLAQQPADLVGVELAGVAVAAGIDQLVFELLQPAMSPIRRIASCSVIGSSPPKSCRRPGRSGYS